MKYDRDNGIALIIVGSGFPCSMVDALRRRGQGPERAGNGARARAGNGIRSSDRNAEKPRHRHPVPSISCVHARRPVLSALSVYVLLNAETIASATVVLLVAGLSAVCVISIVVSVTV
jgi:hypothetical protein